MGVRIEDLVRVEEVTFGAMCNREVDSLTWQQMGLMRK